MEQFFLEQLVEDKEYFEQIARADMVRVLLRERVTFKAQSTSTREQGERQDDVEARPAWDPGSAREAKQKLAEFDERLERSVTRAREREEGRRR